MEKMAIDKLVLLPSLFPCATTLPVFLACWEFFFCDGTCYHNTAIEQHEGKIEETGTGFFLHSLIFMVIAGSLSPMVHRQNSISNVPSLALSHLHVEDYDTIRLMNQAVLRTDFCNRTTDVFQCSGILCEKRSGSKDCEIC